MSIKPSTHWHKASFDRFLHDHLPRLLADRLPLVGYQALPTGDYACCVRVTLAAPSGEVELEFADIPQPDQDGLFEIQGVCYVVVPTASQEDLDLADIRCVGEQLYAYVEERLGQAPPDLPWDGTMARAWLPLDAWFSEFLSDKARRLAATNWLSRHTHLRRLIVLNRENVITPGQFGRVCPFEMPEGPNLGHVFTVAVGAEIREGKLIVLDERPAATLGLSASMIPFLEHSDPNRLLMGANMMRQWITPPDPEPALVQTGHEPDVPDFWAGRNLLTAFVSWGEDTVFDGIVISASCAQRLNAPYPAEPGDKLSNRHGTKGVVSRVLPDDEMPHLPDGTPVELVVNFSGLHVRMNFGQVLEAVMGRSAHAGGTPAIVPPFHAPGLDELKDGLVRAGLPETGMETLTLGRNGPQLQRPSSVGWVYWGRTHHLARGKVRLSVSGQQGQMQGELENLALQDVGAYENLAEYLNTRAIRRPDADTLAARVVAGSVEQANPPTPMYADLVNRLQVAGIQAKLEQDNLTFQFATPDGEGLRLARPVPHPWLPERELTEIGAYSPAMQEHDARAQAAHFPSWSLATRPTLPGDAYDMLVETNARLARMLSSGTPEKLTQDTCAQLETRVKAFFDALLTPEHLCFRERLLFSGRAVIAPGANLRLDQVGLADEIAWTLFGPWVVREMTQAGASNAEEAVQARTARAANVLDQVLARSWIIVNRAPSLSPTALLAFRPVRDPAHVVRLHPLVCEMLEADFDGDQVAIMLPITAGAQREAGERLTVAAHLARDPDLLQAMLPPPDALWGLASLSLTVNGREEINQLAGIEVATPHGFLTKDTLADAMRQVLAQEGIDPALAALERLTRRGFEVTKAAGASLSPFIGSSLSRPPRPQDGDPERWEAYLEALTERIISNTDYDSPELGPQLLAVKIRERGLSQLSWLIGLRGVATDAGAQSVIVRHSYAEGLTADEMYACVAGARRGLAKYAARWEQLGQEVRNRHLPRGFNVLVRARRSKRPGIVFARAAATGEIDPLVDVDSRLMVGLPVPR
jgi:hypothetical protein